MPEHTYFQEEWLSSVKYKLLIAKVKYTIVARCSLFK